MAPGAPLGRSLLQLRPPWSPPDEVQVAVHLHAVAEDRPAGTPPHLAAVLQQVRRFHRIVQALLHRAPEHAEVQISRLDSLKRVGPDPAWRPAEELPRNIQ